MEGLERSRRLAGNHSSYVIDIRLDGAELRPKAKTLAIKEVASVSMWSYCILWKKSFVYTTCGGCVGKVVCGGLCAGLCAQGLCALCAQRRMVVRKVVWAGCARRLCAAIPTQPLLHNHLRLCASSGTTCLAHWICAFLCGTTFWRLCRIFFGWICSIRYGKMF